MKKLNQFIIERLKLSKNSKFDEDSDIIEKYCLAAIYGKYLFDEFKKYFNDNYIKAPKYGGLFIVEPYELTPYYNKTYINIDIFRIPDRYKDKSLEEFKKDFQNNQIKPGELKEFDFKKYLKDNL